MLTSSWFVLGYFACIVMFIKWILFSICIGVIGEQACWNDFRSHETCSLKLLSFDLLSIGRRSDDESLCRQGPAGTHREKR